MTDFFSRMTTVLHSGVLAYNNSVAWNSVGVACGCWTVTINLHALILANLVTISIIAIKCLYYVVGESRSN